MAARALERLEALLTGIYDLDIGCRVEDFLVTDRQALPGECREAPGDEQLFVSAVDDELCMSLYLDAELLERLERHDPSDGLDQDNLADCWTALEGVSHFLCVAHNAGHDRPVSRLALEMQAEIDKYVASFALLRALASTALSRRAAHPPFPPDARRSRARLRARIALSPCKPGGRALLRPARAEAALALRPRGWSLARGTPAFLSLERLRQAQAHRAHLRHLLTTPLS